MIRTLLATAALLAVAAPAFSQPPVANPPGVTALVKYPAKGGRMLTRHHPGPQGRRRHPLGQHPVEDQHLSRSRLEGCAQGVKTYAIIMQDTDIVIRGGPVLHWTMFNIPGSVTKLDAGMTTPPEGSGYGPNYKGAAQSYLGPKTPPNRKDHYHFEVFALDATIPPEAGSSFDAMTAAMDGHILASGEVVGLAQAYPPTLRRRLRTSRPRVQAANRRLELAVNAEALGGVADGFRWMDGVPAAGGDQEPVRRGGLAAKRFPLMTTSSVSLRTMRPANQRPCSVQLTRWPG